MSAKPLQLWTTVHQWSLSIITYSKAKTYPQTGLSSRWLRMKCSVYRDGSHGNSLRESNLWLLIISNSFAICLNMIDSPWKTQHGVMQKRVEKKKRHKRGKQKAFQGRNGGYWLFSRSSRFPESLRHSSRDQLWSACFYETLSQLSRTFVSSYLGETLNTHRKVDNRATFYKDKGNQIEK